MNLHPSARQMRGPLPLFPSPQKGRQASAEKMLENMISGNSFVEPPGGSLCFRGKLISLILLGPQVSRFSSNILLKHFSRFGCIQVQPSTVRVSSNLPSVDATMTLLEMKESMTDVRGHSPLGSAVAGDLLFSRSRMLVTCFLSGVDRSLP
ncbi:hypothetical protein TGRH88_069060 [Toxoplasma gondii]|uniref:Uncharacterized protein n=1 Tax=Toxoplasma gondii TaxID=5811 RepID=A0A7J6K234_TOXGO|nr:hypothetical protein TGRH88_069060 [Toxoplasma gondii]